MEAFDVSSKKKEFDDLKEYIDRVGRERGKLMSILHHGQEVFGYLPIEVQQFISKETGIPLSDIYGVVTFYSNFSIDPKGEYEVGICLGTACYVRGAQAIVDEFSERLGIGVGETSADGKYSIVATRCIGACGLAPVVSINGDVYGNLKKDDVKKILENYQD